MKKILGIIILTIGSWATMTWAEFTQHPTVFYIGLTIAGILVIGALVWTSKKIAKFIGWSLSSCVYLSLTITALSILGFKNILPSGVSIVSGVLLGSLLAVMIIRRVANKAQVSLFWGEIFAWVTGYQLRNIVKDKQLMTIEKVSDEKAKRETVIGALRGKSLNFSEKEAIEAFNYAITKHPNEPADVLLNSAVTYLGSEKLGRKEEGE